MPGIRGGSGANVGVFQSHVGGEFEGEEIRIGEFPERDDNPDNYAYLSKGDVTFTIADDEDKPFLSTGTLHDNIIVVVVGAIYKGRTQIGGASKLTDIISFLKAFSGKGKTVEQAISDLFNFDGVASHIIGIALRQA